MAFHTFLLGDLLLIIGLTGLTFSYQTPYLSQWFGGLSVGDPLPITSIIAVVIGSMTKTAILPFHRWLPNTLTAPTPVSAIMHAGFVNAGAILFAKLSPVLITQPWVMNGLVILGLISAVFGSAAMLVQSDVKRYLTFSTIGQMGFMILECGLGAFHLAIGHLIVHGLFKARFFLGSGSVVEHRRYIRNVTLTQNEKCNGVSYRWSLLAGVIASTGIAFWLGQYFLPLHHSLKNLNPLLGVMLVLSVVFSGLALQKSKGVSLFSIVLSGLFGLALLSGYTLYEGFAEHYLQAWNLMYLFNHSLFATGVAIIVSVLSGFIFLAMVGLLPVPQAIVHRVYMFFLNTSEEPVTPKSSTTTFSHRQAIQA
jgi:NADH:ubiquinone oxidoreductase subunit 4 (subunit M)